MKWIKASERLPDNPNEVHWRHKGFNYIPHYSASFMEVFKDDLEWLDESTEGEDAPSKQDGILNDKAGIARVQATIDDVNKGSIPERFIPIDVKELGNLLDHISQILRAYKMDDTWSEWDESVLQRLTEFQFTITRKP